MLLESILAIVLGALLPVHADQRTPEAIPLHATHVTNTPIPAFGFFGRAHCDAQGNLYFRIGKLTEYNKTEVLSFTPDGTDPKYFELPSLFGATTTYTSFQVMADGALNVLVLRQEPREWLVFHWAAGSGDSTHVRLDLPPGLLIENFATMENGDMVVFGHFGPSAAEDMRGRPYVAELTNSGTVKRALNSDLPQTNASDLRFYDSAFALDGGLLYFVEGNAIKVMSETGTAVRTLEPPKPVENATLASVAIANGRLAVWYRALPPHQDAGRFKLWLEVLDPITGQVQRVYEPGPDLYNMALCFTGRSFIFWNVNKNHFVQLISASID